MSIEKGISTSRTPAELQFEFTIGAQTVSHLSYEGRTKNRKLRTL